MTTKDVIVEECKLHQTHASSYMSNANSNVHITHVTKHKQNMFPSALKPFIQISFVILV